MTIEELWQKPVGVLEVRSFTIEHKGMEYQEYYFLGKRNDGKYFIGFSEDGCYCSELACEEDMVKLIDDERFSSNWAASIYFHDPNLSSWIQ